MHNVLSTSQISLTSKKQNSNKSILKLSTKYGDINIKLRPDLSHGSAQYLNKIIQSNHCDKCNFYRSENPGILQGILENRNIPVNDVFGSCPPDHAKDVKNHCPPHDKG